MGYACAMTDKHTQSDAESLLDSLVKLTGNVAGGTLELARNTATMTAMFGEAWVRNALKGAMEPERLEAMAEAGRFLRDARETAGLSVVELAESLGLADKSVLAEVESGERIMPLEVMLRAVSLLARHDPIPFLIKFMRTYNPALEQTLEQWGVLALPKQYERERRFLNLYRQHDALREFNDEEFDRFVSYVESSTDLVLDVMQKEKAANKPRRARAKPKAKSRSRAKPAGKAADRRRAKRARDAES